jgi:hypothetical protein
MCRRRARELSRRNKLKKLEGKGKCIFTDAWLTGRIGRKSVTMKRK